ncbi:17590_t:CDS:2 [Gigaspora margarita]|uniref:17590_t:CDS:1 n=1 Tax=Gigaspora margarita TaxID=4874 RepID=A0ABN7VQD3_GIGMA|nr:17590_t:CDS:2 [Gigaspora margarita]
MKPHVDEHYCLASVKMAREFATTFANYSLIISQDDKAKISLGIPVVSRTFRYIQTFNESVTISDYDFFCKKYFVGTLSLTHIRDLINISKCNNFVPILKHRDHFKSIQILLVDIGPDENPKYLKNIVEYCHLFRELDFDYLSAQMHAPYRLAYNPVE